MVETFVAPPHSVEAEEAVLGSLLIDPEAITRVAGFLAVEHFYLVKHRWIYEAMLRLHERREPIDLLTVSTELANHNRLEEVGGEPYIAQLTNAVPTALNVEAYARTVEALALRRRMLNAASEIARLSHDQSLPIEQVIERSEAAVFSVTEGRGDGHMRPSARRSATSSSAWSICTSTAASRSASRPATTTWISSPAAYRRAISSSSLPAQAWARRR